LCVIKTLIQAVFAERTVTFNLHYGPADCNQNKLHKQEDGQPDASASIQPVSQQDIFQYRYQFGANLGSIFVLEKWLYGSMFDQSAQGSSELDAVTASLKIQGLDITRDKWQSHWSNALSDQDISFLTIQAHCNMIRLPIGYFTLGPQYCKGTPFEGQMSQVYDQAWPAVLNICSRLARADIGVLIDFHALPGGANGQDHSGTCSGQAAHWQHRSNRGMSKTCLVFIAQEIAAGKIPNATGLQLCNEAEHDAPHLYDWYADVTDSIHDVAPSLPLYVSDGWNLKKALGWTASQNAVSKYGRSNPLVVDTHKYYTFSEEDRNKTPQEIISVVPQALQPASDLGGSVHDRGAAQAFIGEWSCVLDGRTWGRVGAQDKDGLVQQFGKFQCESWAAGSGGHTFWTAKMEWMDGGEWGFFEMIKKGAIAAPRYMSAPVDDVVQRIDQARSQKEGLRGQALQSHSGYWDQNSPGKAFEHHRFEKGYDLGFDDALVFASRGAKIGLLELWVWKRIGESGGRSIFMWEFEQGFRQGVRQAEELVGFRA